MEQLQRRRQAFRQTIRRNDLDSRRKVTRERLTNDLHAAKCRSFICELQRRDPSCLFVELARYISQCQPSEKAPWASVCWEILTNLRFQKWKFGFKGVAGLVCAIFDELDEEQRRRLSHYIIIQKLLEGLEDAVLHGLGSRECLFRVVFQLSLHASKQSNFHIKFSDKHIEAIIDTAHNHANIGSLQVLAIVLLNLEKEALRSCLINKIKQLGRSLYRNLHATQDRQLYLQIIATFGLHWRFDTWDVPIAQIILDERQEIDFSLVLRFFSFQSQNQWMEYKLARPFLLSCSRHYMGKLEIELFLTSIYNICQNECFCQHVLTKIYRQFFSEKMHHFINHKSLHAATDLIVLYIMQRIPQFERELTDWALSIIKMGKQKLQDINKDHLIILCQYVMKDCRISEAELLGYIGEENFDEYWEAYEMNNLDDL